MTKTVYHTSMMKMRFSIMWFQKAIWKSIVVICWYKNWGIKTGTIIRRL